MNILIKKLLLLSLLLTTFVVAGFDSALKKQKFLSPEEAFGVTAVLQDGTLQTKITMADKIHIYENTLFYRIKNELSLTSTSAIFAVLPSLISAEILSNTPSSAPLKVKLFCIGW